MAQLPLPVVRAAPPLLAKPARSNASFREEWRRAMARSISVIPSHFGVGAVGTQPSSSSCEPSTRT